MNRRNEGRLEKSWKEKKKGKKKIRCVDGINDFE